CSQNTGTPTRTRPSSKRTRIFDRRTSSSASLWVQTTPPAARACGGPAAAAKVALYSACAVSTGSGTGGAGWPGLSGPFGKASGQRLRKAATSFSHSGSRGGCAAATASPAVGCMRRPGSAPFGPGERRTGCGKSGDETDDQRFEGAAAAIGVDAEDRLDPSRRDERQHEQDRAGAGEDRLDPEPPPHAHHR